MSVILETSIGDLTVDLYTEERPRCCLNFLKLCKTKYYNFSLFHTVQKDLVAQAGDPTATGRGGESIYGILYGEQARFFEMEVVPRILHTKKGLLSMVNNGSGMHGSQFFITLADNVDYLNNKHTVFGEVAEGMDIVDKLNGAFCDEGNRPHQDIRIYHTVILYDPYQDPDGLVQPPQSPPPTQEMLDSDRIPCDADICDENGISEEQLAEMAAEREAKANTQILEMVGDLPDQEIAAPENVLFVCKLNPVTTSDDLEIIFSRFGDIVSCEVIKDQKTGESLQYAFVEFKRQQDCEMAYFKMDNVLIDDRRIHVDFSQSVSKIQWKGKGRGVDIMKDGNAPKFVLKNQERQSHGYDLVMEEDLHDDVGTKVKSHKKHKKEKRSTDRNKSRHSEERPNNDDGKYGRGLSGRDAVRRDEDVRDRGVHRSNDRSTDRGEFVPSYKKDRDNRNKGRRERSRSREKDSSRHRDNSSRDETRRRNDQAGSYREGERRRGSSSDSSHERDGSDKGRDKRRKKSSRSRKDFDDDDEGDDSYNKKGRNERRTDRGYNDRTETERKKGRPREEVYYKHRGSSSEEEDRRREREKKVKRKYDSESDEDRHRDRESGRSNKRGRDYISDKDKRREKHKYK